MNQFEFLQVTMHVTQICSGTEYRNAFHMVRRQGAEKLARTDKPSDEHAAIRFLIGTWERIATACKGFSVKQRHEFFRHHPILLMWQRLEPATKIIRKNTDESFAKEFENLRDQYQAWIESKDGRLYSTTKQQAVNACFLV